MDHNSVKSEIIFKLWNVYIILFGFQSLKHTNDNLFVEYFKHFGENLEFNGDFNLDLLK